MTIKLRHKSKNKRETKMKRKQQQQQHGEKKITQFREKMKTHFQTSKKKFKKHSLNQTCLSAYLQLDGLGVVKVGSKSK